MAVDRRDQRILFVHAHPDDESIGNGATMAKYVAEGAHVTVVTCTRGEEGEVIPAEMAHLASDRDDTLGDHRETEMASAMAALGVTDHRWLGHAGRYRDSGMIGTPENQRPESFWQADLEEAAALLVPVIRELRPHALVTYDTFGGYGHPDHIKAHRVAMYAQQLAAVRSYRADLGQAWDVPRVFWNAMPESLFRDGLRKLRESGDGSSFEGMDPDGELPPMFVADDQIDVRVDANSHVERKLDAMRAHYTQIEVDGPFFALSNNLGNQVWGTECYRVVKGNVEDVTDLLAGLG